MTSVDEKYNGLWPLPGGVDHYFDTALEMMDFVQAGEPTEDQFIAMLRDRYDTTGEAAMKGYIRVLRTLGWLDLQGGRFVTTKRGQELRTSRDPALGFEDLDARFIGIREVIDLVGQGMGDQKQLLIGLNQRLGTKWTSTNQVFFRLSWLRSLRVIQVGDEGKYELSGKTPVHVQKLDAPTPPQDPSSVSTGEKSSATDELAARIERLAIEGGSGAAFEAAVADAFVALGFEVSRIGGSGDTDLVARGRCGRSRIVIVVDAKSRASGTVGDGDINWAALEDHRRKHDATSVVVVGKSFSTGNAQAHATNHKIRLLCVRDLIDLLREHERAPLGLDALARDLFGSGGTLSDTDRATLLTDIAERVELADTVVKVFREIWNGQSASVPIDANGLYWLLQKQVDVERIRSVLGFLQSSVVAGLSDDAGLHTLCSPAVLARRLERLAELIRQSTDS